MPWKVRTITGPAGAALVLDLVGMQPTLDLSMAIAGVGSDVAIVGLGDGQAAAQVGFFRGAYEVNVAVPYWGARNELIELVDMAYQGVFDIAVERFALEDGVEAYRRLAAGTLHGRAVITPSPRP